MQFIRTTVCGLVALAASSASAQPQPLAFQSGVTQTALLELYTSEGCSSCPPAERWLTSLKKSPGLWKDFVPVAFHVDYWNRLGWPDPWSSKEFSDRQRRYAASWKSTSVYTPGFVLDGKEWQGWRRSKSTPRSSGAGGGGVLRASSTNQTSWQVSFAPASRPWSWYEAHVVLLASQLTSHVKAGENKGRYLNHDFVVVDLAKQPLKTAGDRVWGQVVLKPKTRNQEGRLAIAVWITSSGSLEPIQAVGGWLQPNQPKKEGHVRTAWPSCKLAADEWTTSDGAKLKHQLNRCQARRTWTAPGSR